MNAKEERANSFPEYGLVHWPHIQSLNPISHSWFKILTTALKHLHPCWDCYKEIIQHTLSESRKPWSWKAILACWYCWAGPLATALMATKGTMKGTIWQHAQCVAVAMTTEMLHLDTRPYTKLTRGQGWVIRLLGARFESKCWAPTPGLGTQSWEWCLYRLPHGERPVLCNPSKAQAMGQGWPKTILRGHWPLSCPPYLTTWKHHIHKQAGISSKKWVSVLLRRHSN